MKLEMHKNSLFAVLLRSPWWISFAVAAGLIGAARLVLPDAYAFFAGLPFIVIGVYAAWRQLRAPSAEAVAARLEAIRAMPWDDFAGRTEQAFRREGFTVSRLKGEEGDFELTKAGRSTLVAAKRWKAMRTGIEPLRQVQAARRKREASDCTYLAAGEVTENARAFAAEHEIRLVHGAELVAFLGK
jgi:restriction system protein